MKWEDREQSANIEDRRPKTIEDLILLLEDVEGNGQVPLPRDDPRAAPDPAPYPRHRDNRPMISMDELLYLLSSDIHRTHPEGTVKMPGVHDESDWMDLIP